MNQYESTVVSVSEKVPGTKRTTGRNIEESFVITFDCPQIAAEAKPGQFVMVNCGENTLPRPFSIHRVTGDEVSLYVAKLENGDGTGWLSERKAGDSVKILGPLGNGFSLHEDTRSILLVSGGMGIAPMIFMAESAIKNDMEVTLLYGFPGGDRLPVEEMLPGSKVVIVSEDGSEGHKGLVTDLLPELSSTADSIYICGPAGMYKAIVSNKEELLNGKPTQVSLETHMACGRGICYGCTVEMASGPKRVCEDGPVFSIDEIMV